MEFTRKFNLKQNIHAAEKPFECAHCGKTFAIRDTIRRHFLVHSVERPFVCATCGRTFKSKQYLTQHLVSHATERPFVCGTCGMSFKKKTVLSRHLQIHAVDKTFVCRLCRKEFKHKHSFTAHFKTYHAVSEKNVSYSKNNEEVHRTTTKSNEASEWKINVQPNVMTNPSRYSESIEKKQLLEKYTLSHEERKLFPLKENDVFPSVSMKTFSSPVGTQDDEIRVLVHNAEDTHKLEGPLHQVIERNSEVKPYHHDCHNNNNNTNTEPEREAIIDKKGKNISAIKTEAKKKLLHKKREIQTKVRNENEQKLILRLKNQKKMLSTGNENGPARRMLSITRNGSINKPAHLQSFKLEAQTPRIEKSYLVSRRNTRKRIKRGHDIMLKHFKTMLNIAKKFKSYANGLKATSSRGNLNKGLRMKSQSERKLIKTKFVVEDVSEHQNALINVGVLNKERRGNADWQQDVRISNLQKWSLECKNEYYEPNGRIGKRLLQTQSRIEDKKPLESHKCGFCHKQYDSLLLMVLHISEIHKVTLSFHSCLDICSHNIVGS